VFGCEPFSDEFFFDSTLFRLPLRQVASKISDLVYNESNIKELFEILYTNANSLLLFTQSIRKIEFHILEDEHNGDKPADIKLLFEFEKSPMKYLSKHKEVLNLKINFKEDQANLEFRAQSNVLKASSSAAAKGGKFETSMMICNTIRTDMTNVKQLFQDKLLCESNGELRNDYWLVVSSFNSKYMVNADSNFKKFLPCVGLAAEIE
jgi:hypothetical protein